MIAKISHGSSLYGVLAYNQLKVDERHADVLFTSRIIEPQGDAPYTIGHLSRSFGDYLTANRKTEKPVLHISLNPDPKDCLSEERFVSLAEEYMRRMGFGALKTDTKNKKWRNHRMNRYSSTFYGMLLLYLSTALH